MTWRVHALGVDLGEFAPAWDELNAQLCNSSPVLAASFVSGLLRNFGDGRQKLCVWHQDGGTKGMCILERRRDGLWQSFMPSQAPVGPTLLCCSEDLAGLPQALSGPLVAIDVLSYDPRYGKLYFHGALPMRWRRQANTISVALGGGFAAYWQGRPKKLRANMRRYSARAAAMGLELSLRISHAPDEVSAGVLRYTQLEATSWKGRAGTALGSTASQLQFYADLLREHADQGSAWVYELLAAGQVVASRLVLAQHRQVIALKTTYDENHREWAPGRILLQRFVEDAFERFPDSVLEFYTNSTIDQLAWADQQRSILNVTVYPDRLRALAAMARDQFRQRVWRQDARPASLVELDSVTIHRTVDELPSPAQDLMARAERTNVEWGADWFELFTRTVMRGSSGARFLVLRRGHLAVAVMCINLDPELRRLGGSVGSLSNYYTTLWSPALAPETYSADLEPLINTLRLEGKSPPQLHFAPMDPTSLGFRMLRKALRGAGYVVRERLAHGNWYLPVDGTWETYLSARPGSLRSTIKRMRKRLLAEGARFEIVTDSADLPTAIAAYNTVYGSSWKRPEPVEDFLPELIKLCARRGWLRLGLVWLEGKPIAAQLWITANGRAAIYKVSYDEAYKHFAVGTVLTALLMEHVIDVDRVQEVDYLIGDDEYKKQWMTHRRECYGLVAFDPFTLGGMAALVRAGLSRLRRALKIRGRKDFGKTSDQAASADDARSGAGAAP